MKEKKKEKLPELIKLVDDNFKIRSYQILLSLPFSLIVLILVFFLIYLIPYFIVAPPLEQVYMNLAWLAIGATFLGVIFSSLKLIERNIVESNYKSNHMYVEEKSKPLLKALILMKCKEHKFPLLMLYEKYPSLFNEENLVAMLYDLSPPSIGADKDKKRETTTPKKEHGEKADSNSLIAEYQVLNEFLEKRRSNTLLVMSIMLPTSYLIAQFAISQKDRDFAGFISILALVWVSVSWLFYYTKSKLDEICWKRIHDIERILHIKGHRYIKEEIKCKTWYKVRCYMWHFLFLLLIVAYFFTTYWLFRETTIV